MADGDMAGTTPVIKDAPITYKLTLGRILAFMNSIGSLTRRTLCVGAAVVSVALKKASSAEEPASCCSSE